jgi:hypothetical protein
MGVRDASAWRHTESGAPCGSSVIAGKVRCITENQYEDRPLAVGHFLGYVEQEPAVAFFNAAEESAKTS